jgi:Peptidase family M23
MPFYLAAVTLALGGTDIYRWKSGKLQGNLLEGAATGAVVLSFLLLIIQVWPWPAVGNAGRFTILVALMLYGSAHVFVLVVICRKGRWLPKGRQWVSFAGIASIGIILIVVLGNALLLGNPGGDVRLRFPLKEEWYVGHGGASLVTNIHNWVPSQRFALDLLRVGSDGRSFRGQGKHVTEYYAWAQPVFAPRSGVIREAVDEYPDNPPGVEDKRDTRGNHVLIEGADGVVILLAHMRHGSLRVRAGDDVTEGQLIGEVGNSGNTTQPHLHIDATREVGGQRLGIPMSFDDVAPEVAFPRRGQILARVQ